MTMRVSKLWGAAAILGCSLNVFIACSSDDSVVDVPTEGNNARHTVAMKLVGGCQDFDSPSNARTRADGTTYAWPDKARLYLDFSTNTGSLKGDAVYDSLKNSWEVHYYGSLPTTTQTKCKAYYFENPSSESNSNVVLNSHTAIYEDSVGTYQFDGDTLSLAANLVPKTSRIRFVGDAGTFISVSGIKHYTSFNPTTGRFVSDGSAVRDTVRTGGTSTRYFYGNFASVENPAFMVTVNGTDSYTMNCSNTIFQTGKSGYLDIPMENRRNGWSDGFTYTVRGVTFSMIPVPGYYYCMGETEVTQGLYCAVMGDTTTTPNMPVSNITYSSILLFINRLNSITGANFTLPTRTQWQTAAGGGTKSRNYTYSGSDNVNLVAWYSENSGGHAHEVKQKAPNEIGLYDMSGNVAEYTSERGTSSYNYSYYYCGGAYTLSSGAVTRSSSNYFRTDLNSASAQNYIGFRLCLYRN